MATLKEVAKLAGVSDQAVSAVLNGHLSKASPATRERIFHAAANLNYRPNRSARTLVSGRSGMIGIIVQDTRSPYYADLTWELQNAAEQRGLQTILMQSDWTDKRMVDCICQLHATGADGIVFLAGVSREALRRHGIPDDYPLIQIDDASDTGYHNVGFDYHPGIDAAFRCFLENGHRRLAFVHDPTQKIKYDAYCSCCRKYGIPLREFRYLSPTAAGEDAVISCAHEVAAAAEELDALLVASDYDATLLLRGLAERGIHVPGDLSMIAIDDTLLSRISTPPLTAIRLDRHLLADTAIRRLTARMAQSGDQDGHCFIPTSLICRQSVVSRRKRE